MLSPFLIGLLLLAGAGGPVAEPVCHTGPEGDACAAAVAAVRAERWDEAAICLRICRGADPASAPCRLGWLEGRIHAARGRHEEAEAAFAGLEGCREVPTPLRLLGLFRAARSRGSPRSARSLGRELLRSDPPPGLEVTVRLELAELALELRHPEEASRHLSRVSGKRDAARVLDLRRRIDGARGRTEAAEETALRLLLELPCSPEARTLEPGRAIAQWPPARRMNRARALFRCWDYAAAAALLEGCLREEACAPHHLEAHELLGEIRANRLRDDPAAALGHFEALVKGGRTVEHASYMIGRCLMKLERYDEALEAFQGHLRRYPRGRDAERCRYYLGWLPFDHGRWEASLAPFDDYLARHQGGDLYTYVLWFKGWALYRLGRDREALALFERLARYHKDIVGGKGRYWAAMVLRRLGRNQEAEERLEALVQAHPLTWYGLLAWWRLSAWRGREASHPFLSLPPVAGREPAVDWSPPWLERETRAAFARVGAYARLGETELARELWEPLRREVSGRVPAALRPAWDLALAAALETPDEARTLAAQRWPVRGALPRDADALRWQLEYPRAYWGLVMPEMRRWGAEPLFLDAVMRQESRYRRGVVSWADAMGLVQLIPSTAAMVGGLTGFEVPRDRVFEPAVNLRLGASYLGMLLREFGGIYILAAAAYNSGAPAIKRFLARPGTGIDEAVEDIAYNEGRNYCRKVLGHLMVYLVLHATVEERRALLPYLVPDTVPRTFPGITDF